MQMGRRSRDPQTLLECDEWAKWMQLLLVPRKFGNRMAGKQVLCDQCMGLGRVRCSSCELCYDRDVVFPGTNHTSIHRQGYKWVNLKGKLTLASILFQRIEDDLPSSSSIEETVEVEGVRERGEAAEVSLFGWLTGLTGTAFVALCAPPAGDATAVIMDTAAVALGALLGPERVSCGSILLLLLDDNEVDGGLERR